MFDQIQKHDFSKCDVTLVGYGGMGREYFKALQCLKVGSITVCSRSPEKMKELQGLPGVTVVAGGYANLQAKPKANSVAIVAVPTLDLVAASTWLLELGYGALLVEKPIALDAADIEKFSRRWGNDRKIFCAYNRVAYPVLLHTRAMAEKEGGITSCTYTFTEFVDRIHRGDYPDVEMARWGIANSLHVMSMAHALIGLPKSWKSFHSGNAVEWHPSGSTFVGSGISENGIPFGYHADWGSKGRWSVEIHTHQASYRFCPLEKLFRKENALGDWQEVAVTSLAPDIKVGFVEQVAALLAPELQKEIPLMSIQEAARLTKFGEDIFNYAEEKK